MEADLYGATVTSDDETAIVITWYEPFLDEPVTGYGVDVYEMMSDDQTLVQSHTTTETNIHLMNLNPGTNYSIEIEAIVESGSRVPSTVIGVSTRDGETTSIAQMAATTNMYNVNIVIMQMCMYMGGFGCSLAEYLLWLYCNE